MAANARLPSAVEPAGSSEPASAEPVPAGEHLFVPNNINSVQGQIPNPTTAARSWDPKALLQPKAPAVSTPANGRSKSPASSSSALNGTSSQPANNVLTFQFANNGGNNAYTGITSSATSTLSSPGQHEAQVQEGHGAGGWIERMNHVQDRSSLPQAKRRRLEDSEKAKDGNVVQSRGGSSVLGAYVKEKQKEGDAMRAASALSPATVDLTSNGNDDDDEVMVVDPRNEEVCYGMIRTALLCSIVPSPKPGTRSIFGDRYQPIVKILLKRQSKERNWNIPAIDHTRTVIGQVDIKGSKALVPLLDSNIPIRTECRLPSQPKRADEVPGGPCSRPYNMDVIVYGPLKFANNIGRHMAQCGMTFVAPVMVDKGVKVHNPHVTEARPPQPKTYATDANGAYAGPSTRTMEEMRTEIMGVFDSLKEAEALPEKEADELITTPLLKHQKQGLYFMMEREKPRAMQAKGMDSIWSTRLTASRETVWVNVITGQHQKQEPPETRGGILADMMGLGKTLSILSLVTSTLSEAVQWGTSTNGTAQHAQEQNPTNSRHSMRNIKATLLVCPLSTITNWEEQIRQHIKPGGLSYHIYHGPNRLREAAKLAKFDLIVTTYGSISNEYGSRLKGKEGKFPLGQLSFFRIVLDEAHMIREQSTLQFKAVTQLQAQRRWAVTGTPVQNRLDDLASLLAFIRLEPFIERAKFVRYITEPFKAADTEIVPKLRILVDTITLRRLKDKIDLPPRENILMRLDFSKEEKEVYDMFARNAQDRVKVLTGDNVNKPLGGNTYIHILKAILRLRLLCAHGKDLLNEDDLATLQGMTSDNAIELDDSDDEDKPFLSRAQALNIFSLMLETDRDACLYCNKKLGAHEGADIETENQDEILGYITPCYHVFCRSCIQNYKHQANLALDHATNKGQCPSCEKVVRFEYVELRQRDVDAEHDGPAKGRSSGGGGGKGVAKYSGPHTKTKALVEDLLKTRADSLANPNEPPYKSVVFSGWTSHLDLIELALKANDITFVRLDGSMSRTARTAAMDRFREDPEVQVILVSIMAGGLGLNLTAGNTVYVMEPQYNPAAEAQAIDRVHRLGQERPVRTIRYIMRGSFEEKMLELQDKKMKLANLSMDNKRVEHGDAAKQKLMDLRSLFK